jgi:extracellular factor (EF) 3-hydroxypalmitic acid methyl ester biosynthesis protein
MKAAKKNIQPIEVDTEVSRQEKTFLVHGTRQIPIQAECASKYSIYFRYLDDHPFPESDKPIYFLIKNNGKSVELGPCRILPNPGLEDYAGRLVFMNDVYDVECLLLTDQVVALQAPFDELPAVMAHKDKILPSFKQYTADLAYDLGAYKKIFDDQDIKYHKEPDDVKRSIQQAIIETEGSKFIQFFHEKVEELESLVADFDLEEYQLHGYYFRKQLWDFILCCALMARTNLKPRGYAGDSTMMQMIYQNGYQGDTTFCKLMQKYTVGVPAAQSVRNRRKLIVEILSKFRKTIQLEPEEKIRILSVACGPAFELSDILLSAADFQNYNFTLLDQDQIALEEARQLVSEIEKKCGKKISAEYANMSVRLMFAKNSIEQQLGKFHFIYSMGLFDYLSTPVAKAVIEKLYQLLLPRGELVVGNFHVSNPSKCFMEYWGDWYLMHRTEEEFKSLIKDLNSSMVNINFEDTCSQMFLHVKRQAED